jgi:hypothetical protein
MLDGGWVSTAEEMGHSRQSDAEKPVRIVISGDQSLTRITDYNVSSGRTSLLGLLCVL